MSATQAPPPSDPGPVPDRPGPTPAPRWRGVFAIPVTPFTGDGALDLASLREQVAFLLAAGAAGVCAPVNAGEAWTLTDDERRVVTETVVRAVDGRVPVVAGVSSGSAEATVALARHAAASGADAMIAQPPSGPATSLPAARAMYERLAMATALPVWVQNIDPPFGLRMPPAFVAELLRDLATVAWVKEETMPAGPAMAAEIALAGDALHGVMGGMAGRYMVEEYRRGACGTMPAGEAADVHAQVWAALEAGDEARAREIHTRLLPLLTYEARTLAVCKTVLVRRGVIASDYMRQHAGNPLDAEDRRELDAILAGMRDLFTVAVPRD